MLHDCFGSILRVGRGEYTFICSQCARPFAVLGKKGLSIISKHGKNKDPNLIALKTLKVLIAEVEKKS